MSEERNVGKEGVEGGKTVVGCDRGWRVSIIRRVPVA